MSQILGAVVTVEKYLSKKDFSIHIKHDEENEKTVVFKKDRCYSIPSFQREIRWEEQNVNTLLSDLFNGPQFLGNIILSNNSPNTYDIIDGQQRTTVLLMIVEMINNLYREEIETFELCPINNESFKGFQTIFENGFIKNEKYEEDIITDDYKQANRLYALWNCLSNSELINNRYNAKTLINNLKRSELNIVYCQSPDYALSIRYFLDVNLKGVQLDKEDIFKSYLFSENTNTRVKELWKENKQLNIKFNSIKDGKEDKRYPLMKLYEHFFYCDLYLPKNNSQDFSNIKFGEDFCLTESASVGSKSFYKGAHLIETICNGQYLLSSLERINNLLKIIIDIVQSAGPSDSFKSLFISNDKGSNSKEIAIIHSILQKILLDKEVIPKVLVLKYILSYFDGNSHSKNDYKNIYSIYLACVFFTVFANKKNSDTFYSFVKHENWIIKINMWLNDFIYSHDLTRGKLLASYTYTNPENEDKANEVRCKSLAAIYNYFKLIDNNGDLRVIVSNINDLNNYYNNTESFSLEHLIISKSGKLGIKTEKYDFTYEYTSQIKKYRNSLFNYIFIPRIINDSLGNQSLFQKAEELEKKDSEIICKYSKKYLQLVKNGEFFKNYPTNDKIDSFNTEEEVVAYLDDYFNKYFSEEFLEFSKELTKRFNL